MSDESAKKEEDRIMRSMARASSRASQQIFGNKRQSAVGLTPVNSNVPQPSNPTSSTTPTNFGNTSNVRTVNTVSAQTPPKVQTVQTVQTATTGTATSNVSVSNTRKKWEDNQKQAELKRQEDERKKQEYMNKQKEEIVARRSGRFQAVNPNSNPNTTSNASSNSQTSYNQTSSNVNFNRSSGKFQPVNPNDTPEPKQTPVNEVAPPPSSTPAPPLPPRDDDPVIPPRAEIPKEEERHEIPKEERYEIPKEERYEIPSHHNVEEKQPQRKQTISHDFDSALSQLDELTLELGNQVEDIKKTEKIESDRKESDRKESEKHDDFNFNVPPPVVHKVEEPKVEEPRHDNKSYETHQTHVHEEPLKSAPPKDDVTSALDELEALESSLNFQVKSMDKPAPVSSYRPKVEPPKEEKKPVQAPPHEPVKQPAPHQPVQHQPAPHQPIQRQPAPHQPIQQQPYHQPPQSQATKVPSSGRNQPMIREEGFEVRAVSAQELEGSFRALNDFVHRRLDNIHPQKRTEDEFEVISREMSENSKNFVKSVDGQPFQISQFVENVCVVLSKCEKVASVLYGEEENCKREADSLCSTGKKFAKSCEEFLRIGDECNFKLSSSSAAIKSRQGIFLELSQLIREMQATFQLTVPKCHKCGKQIEGNFTKVDKHSYHKECFSCDVCHQPLLSYISIDNLVLCEKDYQEHLKKTGKAVSCDRCGRSVEGQYVKIDTKNYHNECFTCSECGDHIHGKFFEMEEKVLCERCGSKFS